MVFLISALLFQAGYSPDPYLVFLQSDSVLAGIESVSYDFHFRGTGSLANIIPEVTGKAILTKPEQNSHPVMQLDFIQLIHPGSIPEFRVPVTYMATEDSLYRIDHTRETITKGPAEGIFNYPPTAVLMEYVLPSPFHDEINADSVAILYPETINGVLCHVFHVYYADRMGEAVWYIGKNDFLPYAVERIDYYGPRGTAGGQRLETGFIDTDADSNLDLSPYSNYRKLGFMHLAAPGEQAADVFLADMDGFVEKIVFPRESPVLLSFFSSWDPASLETLGLLNRIAERSDLNATAVSLWESSDPSSRLEGLSMNFKVLIHGEDTAEDYGVVTVPSMVLVSETGEVLFSTDVFEEMTEENIMENLR
ncbi:hypothetical protein CSA37_12090 [Candidatus Fermentibacteria bacterium]|nr:MAG: hypothetical protein CSA37_12090 [Candidatus Fermentibacteria bacterium]